MSSDNSTEISMLNELVALTRQSVDQLLYLYESGEIDDDTLANHLFNKINFLKALGEIPTYFSSIKTFVDNRNVRAVNETKL